MWWNSFWCARSRCFVRCSIFCALFDWVKNRNWYVRMRQWQRARGKPGAHTQTHTRIFSPCSRQHFAFLSLVSLICCIACFILLLYLCRFSLADGLSGTVKAWVRKWAKRSGCHGKTRRISRQPYLPKPASTGSHCSSVCFRGHHPDRPCLRRLPKVWFVVTWHWNV